VNFKYYISAKFMIHIFFINISVIVLVLLISFISSKANEIYFITNFQAKH